MVRGIETIIDLVSIGFISVGPWDRCIVCNGKCNTFRDNGVAVCTLKCLNYLLDNDIKIN